MSIFGNTSQFSIKCCINIQCHQAKLPYTFFTSNVIYFVQKMPIKEQIFEIFQCSGQNSSNSSRQFWNNNSIPLQIFHHLSVSLLNSSVNFKLIYFLLWTKGSHENTYFDIFKCSDENLINSSCHFRKHRSIFLQMLHQYSAPSSKTPLYFF